MTTRILAPERAALGGTVTRLERRSDARRGEPAKRAQVGQDSRKCGRSPRPPRELKLAAAGRRRHLGDERIVLFVEGEAGIGKTTLAPGRADG
jgi:hypothetical protein